MIDNISDRDIQFLRVREPIMTTHPSPARTPSPRAPSEDPHRSLHSQTGPRPGEHPGRSGHPLVKVAGLAWLEFEKPDLDRAGRFGARSEERRVGKECRSRWAP